MTAPPIRCASARLGHRLHGSDRENMLIAAKSGLRSSESPLYAHRHSCPIGTIGALKRAADLLCTLPITSATSRRDSNPHSANPTAGRVPNCPRFPPSRLISRLPPVLLA